MLDESDLLLGKLLLSFLFCSSEFFIKLLLVVMFLEIGLGDGFFKLSSKEGWHLVFLWSQMGELGISENVHVVYGL